ncbi:hypothetical protein [Brevundimonas variabilis]|uniref:Uncharacterized protein n=1 Tax=Brevundimonas variabilis TaxID=74312 RepID=A0A7W9FG07_9CAUL|nr:hypothetical protein [Brevundimonas variabilis]MBB5745934.1 hypothetical protein [Brevundimonas variabilis]
MRRIARLSPIVLVLTASSAVAQGSNTDAYDGLHFHVAAPQGANWSLECRFRPMQITINQYERRFTNQLRYSGSGPRAGRLPGDNGRCVLTKTGGAGPVGLALVKNGVPRAAGTLDPARPAAIDVF